MNNYYIGIDTSNYKTSIAISDESRSIIYSESEFLEVEKGSRGLRQETALFMHNNKLPGFIERALKKVSKAEIRAVSVSSRPRNAEGSYMPVFLAGINAGRIISECLGVPLYEFSHQEGHIEAITFDSDTAVGDRFIAFHLSGGTTEFLLCEKLPAGYCCEVIGGTKDISFGQLLDRTGVKLGYGFPAGKYLDEIALSSEISLKPPRVRIKDGFFNLSGIETHVLREVEKTGEAIIPGLFCEVADIIYDSAAQLAERCNAGKVFIAGGVAASEFISRSIRQRNCHDDFRIVFGRKELSGDNAVGISILGGRAFNESRKCNSGK